MALTRVPLDLNGLAEIDGGLVNAMFTHAVNQISNDCMDRPGLKKARSITITIDFNPIVGETGECDRIDSSVDLKTNLPSRRTADYQMKPAKGGITFNEDFPDDVDQQPLFPKSGDKK